MATPTLSKLFINGEFVDAVDGGSLPVINPATGETFFTVSAGNHKDIDRAVSAAKAAFKTWGRTTGAHRAEIMKRIAAVLSRERERLARLETMDNGKPLKEALVDVDDTADCFTFYAGLAEELDAKPMEEIPVPSAQFKTFVKQEPVGVAGCIIPWNYPLLMAAWKVCPCLASGSTMVLKPSELTPITALELAAACKEAGLPAGVLNIVNGTGVDAGAPLSSHPGVDKCAFTGSVPTGARIMAACAADVKKVSLELGGKSPFVVFGDADVEQAVEWIMFGIYYNQGQVCSATSRLIIQEGPVAQQVLARLAEESQRIRIGNGLAEGTQLGPLVSAGQHAKVLAFVEGAKKQGATVLCGGGRPASQPQGYFMQPTVLTNISPDMTVWKEEIFGPVLCVRTFRTEEEAIEMANDSEYGLGAAVMSRDLERCNRVAGAIRAGILWVNCSQPTFFSAPWGGYKKSGIGRELGRWGLQNYLETKQITHYVDTGKPWGWFLPAKL